MLDVEVPLVYVIEDDAITAAIAKVLVEKSLPGTQVQRYANGQRALQQLQAAVGAGQALPGLILLDLNMPLMDGWEFLEAFATLPLPHPVCVLLLTSSISPADRARAATYQHVAGYFSKPLSTNSLTRMLRLHREACRPGPSAPAGAGALHYLVYQSCATVPFGDVQLAKLLAQSRAFNAAHGLTGVLLYNHRTIMQVLEGSRATVHAVFARIAQDPRHAEVVKLADGPAPHRLFAQWSMGFHTANPAAFQQLTGYANPNQENYLGIDADRPAGELHELLVNFLSDNPLCV